MQPVYDLKQTEQKADKAKQGQTSFFTAINHLLFPITNRACADFRLNVRQCSCGDPSSSQWHVTKVFQFAFKIKVVQGKPDSPKLPRELLLCKILMEGQLPSSQAPQCFSFWI